MMSTIDLSNPEATDVRKSNRLTLLFCLHCATLIATQFCKNDTEAQAGITAYPRIRELLDASQFIPILLPQRLELVRSTANFWAEVTTIAPIRISEPGR